MKGIEEILKGIDIQRHSYSIESLLIHLGEPPRGSVIPPIPVSSTYSVESTEDLAEMFSLLLDSDPEKERKIREETMGIYYRLGNPIEALLAEAVALMEGGETAIIFSDGMRAISSAVSFRTVAGSEIIVGVPVYGCTDNFFRGTAPSQGRVVRFIDLTDPEELRKHITRRTRVVYFETISNPSLRIYDIRRIKEILIEYNKERLEEEKICLVIDNTFATPYCANPLRVGPELKEMIVVHSMTKGMNGFAHGLGGVAVIPWKYYKALFLFRKDNGGILAAEQSHLTLTKSLKTLGMRMRIAVENATALAELCSRHEMVERVIYPGLESHPQYNLAREILRDWYGNFSPGHMMGMILKGRNHEERERRGSQLLNYLARRSKVFTLGVSLGYMGTLMEDPNSGTHASIPEEERIKKGIPRGLLRFSIGTERKEDLLVDMFKALESLKSSI